MQMCTVSLSTWSLRKVCAFPMAIVSHHFCLLWERPSKPGALFFSPLNSSELADLHPPRKDLTSGKNPTRSGSKCGESGGASSAGPFLVKYKVWCSEPRLMVYGGSETGPEVNSKAAAMTASLEETYSPERALYPYAKWTARCEKALLFLQLYLINICFQKCPWP